MPELTPELIATAAKRFGVSEEEVRAQWQELQNLGGEDVVRAELSKMMADLESELDDIVSTAREFVGSQPERARSLSSYYVAVFNQLGDEEKDAERILQYLVMAAFKLAEAEQQVAELLDGTRRASTKEE